MNRYPDEIIILKQQGESTPYHAAPWEQVYHGRCRCFLDRQAAFRINKIMDCTYQVVIPDRNMVEIGENFKVGIKMHTNKSNRNWDLVGYVKDFARFDRVCNLYFQMVKENLIEEDMPPVAYDMTDRKVVEYNDEYVHLETEGLIVNSEHLVQNQLVQMWFEDNEHRVLITTNFPELDDEVLYIREAGASEGTLTATGLTNFAGLYYDEINELDKILFVPKYVEETEDYRPTVTLHVQEERLNEETQETEYVDIYTKDFVIIE